MIQTLLGAIYVVSLFIIIVSKLINRILKSLDFTGNAQIANIVKNAALQKKKTCFFTAINVIKLSIPFVKTHRYHAFQIVAGNAMNALNANFVDLKTFSNQIRL